MQNHQILASELKSKVEELIKIVETEFQNLDFETLNHKENADKWSVAECLEHLNRYNAFYNPEFSVSVSKNIAIQKADFQSNWLGKYCINLVKNNPKKQKTLKHMNPTNSQIDKNVISVFLQNQIELLDIIEKSTKVDWTKSKVRIEFAKFMKLRLGDALQFVIYHQERHIKQAQKAVLKTSKFQDQNKLIV